MRINPHIMELGKSHTQVMLGTTIMEETITITITTTTMQEVTGTTITTITEGEETITIGITINIPLFDDGQTNYFNKF